ncbi:MAG: DUF4838 domain-containing protein [Clostridiales bacterium]|nr:DUF4838 domain-containing protein [Clostridiales bacterium]
MSFSALSAFMTKFIGTLLALITSLGNIANPALDVFVPKDVTEEPVEQVEMMTLIENGVSDYVIVCAKSQGDPEYTAALKLQKYLKQMSGVQLPIVSDSVSESAEEIIVGKTSREGSAYTVDREYLGDEGVNFFTLGKKLVIAGGEKRGTLYSVYTFLEEVLDCHWYTSELIIIPESAKVEIPAELNTVQLPSLEYRETDWISPRDVEYSMANKLNSNIYRYLSEENGGTVGYSGSFAHTLTTHFVSSEKYFDSHPEYYALRDGERVPEQLCLTNPDVLEIIIEEVRAQLRSDPNKQIVSLTQHDNQKYCTCENCAAIDEAEGSHSGTMITFINAVADAIKDEFPKIAVDTFAYQYTRKPPKTVKPRENVIVRLCSIECCFAHSLSNKDCEKNAEFCKDLEGWSQICNRLYVWDYTTNYACYLAPFSNFKVMQDNMRFFVKNNVVGIYEEGNYTASQCDAEFAELRAYLLSKLLWNPNVDYLAEMNAFLKAYYGDGWQYIREYIDMTSEHTGTNGNHMGIYEHLCSEGMLSMTDNEIAYCDDLWENAKALAQTPEMLENVKRSEMSWRLWKSANQKAEFSRTQLPSKWKGANEDLYNDYIELGVVRYSEGRMFPENPDFSEIPTRWR